MSKESHEQNTATFDLSSSAFLYVKFSYSVLWNEWWLVSRDTVAFFDMKVPHLFHFSMFHLRTVFEYFQQGIFPWDKIYLNLKKFVSDQNIGIIPLKKGANQSSDSEQRVMKCGVCCLFCWVWIFKCQLSERGESQITVVQVFTWSEMIK